jgi:hypothetical protein
MEKKVFFIVMLVVLSLIVGCSNNPKTVDNGQEGATSGEGSTTEQETAAPKTGLEVGETVGLDKIYLYDVLNSYEYLVSNNNSESMNMKYTISSDTIDGTEAWLQQSDVSAGPVKMTSRVWFSKATYKCLMMQTVVDTNGEIANYPAECPPDDTQAGSSGAIPLVTYMGKESVTVPYGTFNADKYSTGELNYWVSAGIPVPVKVASGSGSTIMELVDYS